MDKPNQRKEKTKAEWLQEIVNDYIDEGQSWPADRRTIAAWAVANKRYEATRPSIVDQCAKELAEAMRLEMEVDPQGRTVRAKYCAKISEMDDKGKSVQRTLWFGRTAEPNLMHRSLQQRRNNVLGDCKQLKTDQDSYNENNKWGATLQLSFNFEKDLADLEHDTEYNPQPPPEDED
jgi:hypothetical protein